MIHCAHRAILYSVNVTVIHPYARHGPRRGLVYQEYIHVYSAVGLEQEFCNGARATASTFNP